MGVPKTLQDNGESLITERDSIRKTKKKNEALAISSPKNSTKSKKMKLKKQTNKEEARSDNKQKGTTPYQGPFRTCGLFHCDHCKKEWFSANSWANCYQKCNSCKKEIYPYRQFPPMRSGAPKKKTPKHPQVMCQKCMQLGSNCAAFGTKMVKHSDVSYEREE